jgi:hypothetical protein
VRHARWRAGEVSWRGQSPRDGGGVVARDREGVRGSQRRDSAAGGRAASESVSSEASRCCGGRERQGAEDGLVCAFARARLGRKRLSRSGASTSCLDGGNDGRVRGGITGGHEREHGIVPIYAHPSTLNSSRDYQVIIFLNQRDGAHDILITCFNYYSLVYHLYSSHD